MDYIIIIKSLTSLAVVISIIYGFSYAIKKIGEKSFGFKIPTNKNLKIEELMPIDTSRRIAVVQYLNKKYVLLLGAHDAVIDIINVKK